MKRKITTIANLAGVSPATVSNALNGRKGVSEETKLKVLEIAREIGYNKEISNGISKSIRFIVYKKHGYVISDTPFFSSLIEGIAKECRDEGYELLISHINTDEANYKDTIENIIKDNSAGLLLLATEMFPEDMELFNGVSAPIVLLDSYFKNMDYDTVLINNTSASYKATNYLALNGHANIGYLHSSIYINNFHYRKLGYIDALNENNLEMNEKYILSLEPTMEGSYRDMKKILEERDFELPTAFFADNDIIALGAMRAMKEKGIKIPQDVSVIGFDDMPFCEITNPRLTTIKVFKQEIGGIAVRRLLEKITNNDNTIHKIEVGTDLIIRDSVLNLNKHEYNKQVPEV
jgi:LacI family transcriptional regulator